MIDLIPSVIERSDLSTPLDNFLEYQRYFGGFFLIGILGLIMVLGLWLFNQIKLNRLNYFIGRRLGKKRMSYSLPLKNINLIKNMNDKIFLSIFNEIKLNLNKYL
jgi:hypothetical protein